jgi:hypothetical protein
MDETEPSDPRDQAADLDRMAADARDATWGTGSSPRSKMIGLFSGDFSTKGTIAAQHRELSRRERASHDRVPSGAMHEGGAKYLLLPLLGIAAALLLLVVVLVWLLG